MALPRTWHGWKKLFWLSLYCCPVHHTLLRADFAPYDDGTGYCFNCEGVGVWRHSGLLNVLRANRRRA